MSALNRSLGRLVRAPLDYRHYLSVARAAFVFERPLQFLSAYVLQRGQYPSRVALKTPLGRLEIELLNPRDTYTVNEVFSWEIYRTDNYPKVIVDFGSNIGVSELYFLSRNDRNVVYGFEPVPRLYAQLQKNTALFSGRVFNQCVAISTETGHEVMGIEPSGRYGGIGIGIESESAIRVPVLDVNRALATVLQQHEAIDVLKVDIEGLEEKVLNAVTRQHLARIKMIYVEAGDDDTLFPTSLHDLFERVPRRGICRFVNRLLGGSPGALRA